MSSNHQSPTSNPVPSVEPTDDTPITPTDIISQVPPTTENVLETSDETSEPETPLRPSEGEQALGDTAGTGTIIALGCITGTIFLIVLGLIYLLISQVFA